MLANEPWPALEGLHVGLDELGYGEGADFLIEYRFAEGDAGRFPGLAAELVRLSVDVIVAWGTPGTLAALKATSSIPIVMSAGDPVGAGLVASLARSGGNVTGLSSQTAGGEEKRLELLKELRPNLSRVAVLSNSTNPLRAQGFIPHAFAALKKWPISPLQFEGNPTTPVNQLLEADLVYVRDFVHPDSISSEQNHLVEARAIGPDAVTDTRDTRPISEISGLFCCAAKRHSRLPVW